MKKDKFNAVEFGVHTETYIKLKKDYKFHNEMIDKTVERKHRKLESERAYVEAICSNLEDENEIINTKRDFYLTTYIYRMRDKDYHKKVENMAIELMENTPYIKRMTMN